MFVASTNAQMVGFSCIASVALAFGWPCLQRRVQHPSRVRALTLFLVGAAGAINLACCVLRPGGRVCAVGAVLGGTALVAATVTVTREAIPVHRVVLPRRILAIGAHPDDIELACGATIAKLADSGFEVRALVMSSGRVGGNGAVRPEEAKAAAHFLGVTSLQVLDFPDTSLAEAGNGMVQAIETALHRFNPDLILTHSANDQHQDHFAVHMATLRAARRHRSILCFESPSATRAFDPDIFVDVDHYLDVKVEAVARHDDQRAKPYMGAESLRAIAAFRGSQAKRLSCEAFEAVRILGSTLGAL